jgi:biopolymer transport protein ExbD
MGAKLAGSGGGKRGQLDVNAEPNVIPFIDVMLVLLIIFMVAAPIATVDIQVPLPQTKEVLASKRPPKPTWVSVKEEPAGSGAVRVWVMNEEVTFDALPEKVEEYILENNPKARNDEYEKYNTRIYVRADGDMKYKYVMRAMNGIGNAGFPKVALVTEDRRR